MTVIADSDTMTPVDRLEVANRMAHQYALDAAMRDVAKTILEGVGSVPAHGSERIASWIRKHVTYQQEAPGVEILQGPYTTLRHLVGDCDDLAILWATITRSAGLDTYVAGVAEQYDWGTFYHAVGYDWGTGRHYELSRDQRYGGKWQNGSTFTTPAESGTVIYVPDPDREGFWLSPGPGRPYVPVERRELESEMFTMGQQKQWTEASKQEANAAAATASAEGGGNTGWLDVAETAAGPGGALGDLFGMFGSIFGSGAPASTPAQSDLSFAPDGNEVPPTATVVPVGPSTMTLLLGAAAVAAVVYLAVKG